MPLQLAAAHQKSVLAMTGHSVAGVPRLRWLAPAGLVEVERSWQSGKHTRTVIVKKKKKIHFFLVRKNYWRVGIGMPLPFGMATGNQFSDDGTVAGITGIFVLLADEVKPGRKSIDGQLHHRDKRSITIWLMIDPGCLYAHFWA